MRTSGDFFILFGLLLAGLSSCSQEDYSSLGETGSFSMNVQASNEVIVGVDASRAEAGGKSGEGAAAESLPDVNDFSVSVSSHGEKVLSWDTYRTMSEEENFELRPGAYVAKAWYGDLSDEGFDKPYFEGSQDFTVKRGETTPVNVSCYLANARLAVVYTDDFKSYFSAAYSAEVTGASGNKVAYVQDEQRSAYFAPGTVSVRVKVRKAGQAQEAEYEVKSFQAEARHAYTLTLDVDVSSATMTVEFSEEVSDENVSFDVSNEALNAPAPYLKASGFVPENILEPVEGANAKEQLSVYVNAAAGLASCKMTVASSYLEEKGVSGEIDLTAADAKLETLKGLGFQTKGLSGNVSQMALVDYTGLVGNLPAGRGESAFELRAIDKYGKVSDPLTLRVAPQLCNFAVSPTDVEVPFLGNTCQVSISFVDGDPSKASFVLADGSQPLTVTGISEGMATENGRQYIVSLQAPDGVQFKDPFKVSASYLAYSLESAELPVSYGILVDSEADVWAKRAVVHVYNEENLSALQFQQYKAGKWENVSVKEIDGNYVTVNGLSSNSALKLRARKTDAEPTNEVEIQTEEELQVPNAGMESWSYERGGDYWGIWYPWNEPETDGWNTLNLKTTSDGSDNFPYDYAYVANSGTKETADCHKGEKAALIRTVGWGAGTTAPGPFWDGSMTHTDPGYLYLGKKSESPETDYSPYLFASRPDALSFYYKYTPSSGRSASNDNFEVWVKVENRDGSPTVLGQGYLKSGGKVTNYTQGSISIKYTADYRDRKATHIYIIFKSGTETRYNYMSVPPRMNLSDGEYIGSQLYIDDVSLIYE